MDLVGVTACISLTIGLKNIILKWSMLNCNRSARRRAATAGFTLIEMLVVIGIITVLAVMVLVLVDPVEKINNAKDAERKTDVGQVATAASTYYFSNNGSYTGVSVAVLVANGHIKSNLPNVTITPHASGSRAVIYAQLVSKSVTCPVGQSGTKYWVHRTQTGVSDYECSNTAPTP